MWKILLSTGLVLAAVWLPVPADAAAIDCAKPKGSNETAICADPALRQLDQDLAAAYDRLAAAASPAGQARVRRGEHERRAFIEELCAPADTACLAAAYHQGVSSVTKFAGQAAGGVLVPVEHFHLADDPRTPARKTSVELAFPRLDQPAAPWADRFEQAARAKAESLLPDDAGTDAVVDYRPTYLAPDLAAVAFAVWTYPHGAAHGIGHQAALAYLPAKQRGLLPSDLFQAGTTWSGFLAEQAFLALQDQAQKDGWTLSVAGPGELETAVADPADWLVRPAGLGLAFAPATVGPYVAGEREVLVPWTDLKPYLSATPAFKVPAVE